MVVMSAMLVSGLLAFIYAMVSEPVYQAEVVLLPSAADDVSAPSRIGSGLTSLASIAGVNLQSESQLRVEALATLKSRSFLSKFITDHGLLNILTEASGDSADGEEVPSLNRAYDEFTESIMTVREDLGTGLVTVQINWKDPEVAAKWANDLVGELNEEMRSRASDLARASIKYLEDELADTNNAALRLSIGSQLERQINRIMIANVRSEYAFRIIDPAVPSDPDSPVFPNTLLMVGGGLALGLIVSVGLISLGSLVSFRSTQRD